MKILKKNYKLLLSYAVTLLLVSLGVSPVLAAITHNIQKGETLYQIAVSHGVTVQELKQANHLQGDLIITGDQLTIPGAAGADKIENHPKDLELLARLVAAEAGGEPFKGQVAVASVIINRTNDVRFPETVAGNIFKPHEFESVSNGLIWKEPTVKAYQAVRAALKGWDPTAGAKFFYNPAKLRGPSWVGGRPVIDRIGHHVFAV